MKYLFEVVVDGKPRYYATSLEEAQSWFSSEMLRNQTCKVNRLANGLVASPQTTQTWLWSNDKVDWIALF